MSKSFLLLIGLENKRESYIYISRVFIDGCDDDVLTPKTLLLTWVSVFSS